MKRREFLAGSAGAAVLGATGLRPALAAAEPTMTTVAKIVGVPYFSLLEQGLVSAGKQMDIASTMVGPAHVDPAQQVRLVEDTIAKKVDVLGLIPLDTKVLAPVVQRARDAGIVVIT
ncbi:MAG: substrate-binding domain-containing protein, partial [Gluconacetobacter diazotrophicus]|nr:substrate-binding domain-containing protein [Gluconacetobacter diazotrophicus]